MDDDFCALLHASCFGNVVRSISMYLFRKTQWEKCFNFGSFPVKRGKNQEFQEETISDFFFAMFVDFWVVNLGLVKRNSTCKLTRKDSLILNLRKRCENFQSAFKHCALGMLE